MPVTHRRSQQKQQADSRPPQEPQTTQKEAGLEEEERELSVEEVRQKLQRSRRPLVSYEKEEPGDIPGDEEQGGHHLDSTVRTCGGESRVENKDYPSRISFASLHWN